MHSGLRRDRAEDRFPAAEAGRDWGGVDFSKWNCFIGTRTDDGRVDA